VIDWEKLLAWLVMLILSILFWVGAYYAALFCYHVLIKIGG